METSKTPERTTAEDLVEAFNRMDIDVIIACRSADCLRYIAPASLGHKPTNNEQYRTILEKLKRIFHNFSLTVNDILEDTKAKRICMHLSARADTLAGEYVNEYMWTLDFDETGTKIVKSTEFVDSVVNVNFWPKLQVAMAANQRSLSMSGLTPSSS